MYDFLQPLRANYRPQRTGRAAERYADHCRRLCEAKQDGFAEPGGGSPTPSRAQRRAPARKPASSGDGDSDGEPVPRFTISRQDGVVIGAATAGTLLFLMAQYGGRAIVPIELVCADYFGSLTLPNLRRKIAAGDVPLPLVRMEAGSVKAAQGVHLQDLAEYIDARRSAAVKERDQLCS